MKKSFSYLNSSYERFIRSGALGKAFAVLVLITGFFLTAQNAFAVNYATYSEVSGVLTIDSTPTEHLVYSLDVDWSSFEYFCYKTSPTPVGGDISSEPSSFWLDCFTDEPLDPGYGTIQHWNFSISSPGTLIYNSNSTASSRNFETYYFTPGVPLGFSSSVSFSNPVSPRLQRPYFNFTGSLNNANFEYDTLQIETYDSDSDLYRTHTLPVCDSVPCSMYNVPFSVPSSLYLAGNYTFRGRLTDGTNSTDWTTSIPFRVVLEYVPADLETYDPTVLDFEECSTLEIFCHLKNVLTWFFGVSDSTLSQFNNITLENVFPFAYLYELPNLFESLSGDTASNLVMNVDIAGNSLEVIDVSALSSLPGVSLMRSFLGYLLWFLLVISLYGRVSRVFDDRTPV